MHGIILGLRKVLDGKVASRLCTSERRMAGVSLSLETQISWQDPNAHIA